MTKPDSCRTCGYYNLSTGYLADNVPERPRFAIVRAMPAKDELVMLQPMAHAGGRAFERHYLLPLGIRAMDLLVTSVIRCVPNGREFPTGREKGLAVKGCRQYDGALWAYNPDIFVLTYSPTMLFKQPNLETFIKRALELVVKLSDDGHKVCLLLGDETKDAATPWLTGGMKKWSRHYWKGTYHELYKV